jgi:carboxyl-terminal processing protease
MTSNTRTTLIIVAIPIALLIGLIAGVLLDRYSQLPQLPTTNQTTHPSPPDFNLVRDAWKTIDRVYVDRAALKSKPLTYGAILGMVDALGDTGHSTFLSPDMVRQEHTLTRGEYVGVGLEIQMRNGAVTIVAPFDGSPAGKAGLRAGDIILKVDGKDVGSSSLQQVVQMIVGKMGTKVTLTIFSPETRKTSEVALIRSRITLHNVTWHRVPGTDIADIRIAAFSQGVTKDLRAILAQVNKEKLGGIVLDLRNDPGGVLDEAIGVASQFLAKGNVLLTKNADGKITPDPVESGGLATDIPMVVLINDGTASASEIVAGALQDPKRAPLIGETTFGTGTVLGQYPLPDGSELLLATQEWLTPAGRTIWHKGIDPDVKVALPLDAMLVEPDGLATMSPAELAGSDDKQLLKGLELLKEKIQGIKKAS